MTKRAATRESTVPRERVRPGGSKRRALTAQETAWLERFLTTENAEEAVQHVYGLPPGSTASNKAQNLINSPLLAPLITAARRRATAASQAVIERATQGYVHTQERITLELHRIAYVDTAAAAMKRPDQLNEDERRAIRSIEVIRRTLKDGSTEERFKYVFYSKVDALRLLGITLGMWTDAPPPPPPVAADQQPQVEDDRERRAAAARRELRAMLQDLAKPAPLTIEGEPLVRRPVSNGTTH